MRAAPGPPSRPSGSPVASRTPRAPALAPIEPGKPAFQDLGDLPVAKAKICRGVESGQPPRWAGERGIWRHGPPPAGRKDAGWGLCSVGRPPPAPHDPPTLY